MNNNPDFRSLRMAANPWSGPPQGSTGTHLITLTVSTSCITELDLPILRTDGL